MPSPEPSRSAATCRPGRPPRINGDDLAQAALAIADEEGLDELSLRAVADRLGVTPAALYRLVAGPVDLVAIVVEAAIDHATSEELVVPAGWRAAVEGSARLLRKVLLEHPMLVEAYQRRLVVSASSRKLIDEVLAEILAAGLDEAAAVEIYAMVQAFVVGYVALEHRRAVLCARAGSGWAKTIVDDPQLARRFAKDYFAPEGFNGALRMVLDGVATRVERLKDAPLPATAKTAFRGGVHEG